MVDIIWVFLAFFVCIIVVIIEEERIYKIKGLLKKRAGGRLAYDHLYLMLILTQRQSVKSYLRARDMEKTIKDLFDRGFIKTYAPDVTNHADLEDWLLARKSFTQPWFSNGLPPSSLKRLMADKKEAEKALRKFLTPEWENTLFPQEKKADDKQEQTT